MGIQVLWDDEIHTIIRYTFSGHWELDELQDALLAGIELDNSVTHQVDFLVDIRASDAPPLDINTELQIKNALAMMRDPNTIIVFVGSDLQVRNMTLIGQEIYRQTGKELFVATSLERGREIIYEQRARQ